MTNIILDTNIILRYPKILGLQLPNTTFIVPLDVIDELSHRATQRGASFDRRIDLIEKASHQGTVAIVNTDLPIFRRYQELISTPNLSGADIAIVATALAYLEKGETVKIATLDKAIQKFASEKQIEILGYEDVEKLLGNFVKPTDKNTSVQNEIVTYEQTEKRNLFYGILIGIIVTLLATFIYKNIQNIISTINVWGTILLIIFIGISLFLFRERNRLSYGVFEFLVGVVAIIILFKPSNFDFARINFNLDFNIKLLGGLYIMVRGQDNIVKALKDTKVGLYLKDKFGIGA
ncbi:MAG: PIN domain-containing protein [Dyadobacter sp.]